MKRPRILLKSSFLTVLLALTMLITHSVAAHANNDPHGFECGATANRLYVLNNTSGENSISTYDSADNGKLTYTGKVLIGGGGTDTFLHSQNPMVFSTNKQWLFAVDAGSNQISVVKVNNGCLQPVGTFASGGIHPVSLTFTMNRVYVVNSGDNTTPANVAGFAVWRDGTLIPIPNAIRPLSVAAPDPGEISATPSGTQLIITEKASNSIDGYTINPDGSLSAGSFVPAAATTPYGFDFLPGKSSIFVVAHADGNIASYTTALSNSAVKVFGPLNILQNAPCWVRISKDGRLAWILNSGSSTVSTLRLAKNGSFFVTATQSTGAGTTPIDFALDGDEDAAYTLNLALHNLTVFQVNKKGSLTSIQSTLQILPAGSTGILTATFKPLCAQPQVVRSTNPVSTGANQARKAHLR